MGVLRRWPRRRRRRSACREAALSPLRAAGCRLPTAPSVGSRKTHADQDDDAIAAAAGYKRDAHPEPATDRLLGGASGGAPPEALRSLELSCAARRRWRLGVPARAAAHCAALRRRRGQAAPCHAPRAHKARAAAGDRDRERRPTRRRRGCTISSAGCAELLRCAASLDAHRRRLPAVEGRRRRRRRCRFDGAGARMRCTTRRTDAGARRERGLRGGEPAAGGTRSRSRCAARGRRYDDRRAARR